MKYHRMCVSMEYVRFECVRFYCCYLKERRSNRRKSGKKTRSVFNVLKSHLNSQIAIHYAVIVGCIHKLLLAGLVMMTMIFWICRMQCGSCMCIVSAMCASRKKGERQRNEEEKKQQHT